MKNKKILSFFLLFGLSFILIPSVFAHQLLLPVKSPYDYAYAKIITATNTKYIKQGQVFTYTDITTPKSVILAENMYRMRFVTGKLKGKYFNCTETVYLNEPKTFYKSGRIVFIKYCASQNNVITHAEITGTIRRVDNYYLFHTQRGKQRFVRGIITNIRPLDQKELLTNYDYTNKNLTAFGYTVLLTSGAHKGESLLAIHNKYKYDPYKVTADVGDAVVVNYEEFDADTLVYPRILEPIRFVWILILIGMFIIVVIAVSRLSGMRSLLGLFLSILFIFFFLIPLALRGWSPLLLSIIVSVFATAVSIPLILGLNLKTLVSIIGTVGGVIIAGLVSVIFAGLMNITGMFAHEFRDLFFITKGVFDFGGLIHASIIIGAIGAIMDVAISIASSANEIASVNPDIQFMDLFLSTYRVGTDILGSMTNTLVMAYVGSSLPMLLVFTRQFGDSIGLPVLLNMDNFAIEILRAIAGSLGMFTAIPLTALVASFIFSSKKTSPSLPAENNT